MKHIFLLLVLSTMFTHVLLERSREKTITIPVSKRIGISEIMDKHIQVHIDGMVKPKDLSHNVGKEPLHNINNGYYTGIISIGDPPQHVRMDFDTGSGLFWVLSPEFCNGTFQSCGNHSTYNHSLSRTYEEDGTPFHVYYVTGYLTGILSVDDVTVGKVTAKNQVFGEALDLDENTRRSRIDGIFGLSFAPDVISNLSNIDPPFVTMVKQGVVDRPVFSFYLTKAESKTPSQLILGGVDDKLYTGVFVFTPVVNNNYWRIIVDKIYVPDGEGCIDIGGPFINVTVDSGSTAIYGPPIVTTALNKATGATFNMSLGLYTVDCNKINTLRTIIIVISGKRLPLRPEDYVIKFISSYYGVVCCNGILGNGRLKRIILGENFMRAYYTIFNVEQRLIGFARAV